VAESAAERDEGALALPDQEGQAVELLLAGRNGPDVGQQVEAAVGVRREVDRAVVVLHWSFIQPQRGSPGRTAADRLGASRPRPDCATKTPNSTSSAPTASPTVNGAPTTYQATPTDSAGERPAIGAARPAATYV